MINDTNEKKEKLSEAVTKRRRFPVWAVITIAVVLVAVVSGIVAIAQSGSPERRAMKQLELARKYVAELNYEQAIIAYEAVIKIDPKNVDAYIGLADVYAEIGEDDKAREMLDLAVKSADEEQQEEVKNRTKEIEAKLDKGDDVANAATPTPTPTPQSTPEPTETPTSEPTEEPTPEQTATEAPTPEPTQTPTPEPTATPTPEPTDTPTLEPTATEAPTPTQSSEISADMSAMRSAKRGDIILFGNYEQDNDTSNGKEPIEWIVLSNSGSELFVLSKYGLSNKMYNTDWVFVTWEECTLRKWLNEVFYNVAFSETDKKLIKKTKVKNTDNPEYGTSGGNDTKDRVFLLSLEDMVNTRYGFSSDYYEDDIARCCAATAFAIAHGAYTSWYDAEAEEWMQCVIADGEPTCWWWLRSPGGYECTAAFVTPVGTVYAGGMKNFGDNAYAVRPALVIDLNQ